MECPKCGQKMSSRSVREANTLEKKGSTRRYYTCMKRRNSAFTPKASEVAEDQQGCGFSFWTIETPETAFDVILDAAMRYADIVRMTGGKPISGVPALSEVTKSRAAEQAGKAAARKKRRKAREAARRTYAEEKGRSDIHRTDATAAHNGASGHRNGHGKGDQKMLAVKVPLLTTETIQNGKTLT